MIASINQQREREREINTAISFHIGAFSLIYDRKRRQPSICQAVKHLHVSRTDLHEINSGCVYDSLRRSSTIAPF